MNILLDHNVPRRLGALLRGHRVSTTRAMGWEKLTNGLLLQSARDSGFDALLSIDKNLEYEQNLRRLRLPVIVVDSSSNALPAIVAFVPKILEICAGPLDPILYVIQPSGSVLRLTEPRRQ